MDKSVLLSKSTLLDNSVLLDYGTIRVQFLHGLTWDQKASILKMSVENQLVTNNREHYIQILNECLSFAQILTGEDYPFSMKWSIVGKYQYVFEVQEVSHAP